MQDILDTLIKQNAKMNETILELFNTMQLNQQDEQLKIPHKKRRCTRSKDPASRQSRIRQISDKLELIDSQDSSEQKKRYRPKRDRDFVPAMRVNYNRKPQRRRTSVKKVNTNELPLIEQESAQPSQTMNQNQNNQIWIEFTDEFEKDKSQKVVFESEPMTLSQPAQDIAARILNETYPKYRISHSQCQKSLEQKPIAQHHTYLKSITERFKLQCDECQKFFKFQRNLDNHKAEEHTIQLTLF